jgi:hypothetical protein
MCFATGGSGGCRRDRIGNEVDDQVGFNIPQDKVAAKEPILEFGRQRRQLQQQSRRHGRQRQGGGIIRIDGRRHFNRHLDEDGFLLAEGPPTKVLGDDVAVLVGGRSRKYVALLRPRAFDADFVGERSLAPG